MADRKKSLNRDKGVAICRLLDAVAKILSPTSTYLSSVYAVCVCSEEGCSIAAETSASFVVKVLALDLRIRNYHEQ